MIVQCKQCGREFNARPYNLKMGWQKCCSRKCQNISQSKNGHWRWDNTIHKCMTCGIVFRPKQYQINKGNGKFCSIKCSQLGKKKAFGKDVWNWKEKVKKICPVCGKEFNVKPSHSWRKYCSRECMKIGYKQQLKGISNPHWKGGITPVNSRIRDSKQYGLWKNQCLTRDNFTCRKCGVKGNGLHVHHWKKLSVILNDIRQKYPLLSVQDIAGQHLDLWDTGNGITLCKKCHKLEHQKNKNEIL